MSRAPCMSARHNPAVHAGRRCPACDSWRFQAPIVVADPLACELVAPSPAWGSRRGATAERRVATP